MTKCYFCEILIKDIPYRCKFCGMVFCNKHRIPENHDCPFDLRKKSKNSKFLGKTLYEDALEYMSKELTVAKIYNDVTTKQMTKLEASELLNYFLESSDDSEIRKVSILAIKELELKNERAFSILENCILSDEDPEVKSIAIEIIAHLFPKKSKELLNWISKNKNDLES